MTGEKVSIIDKSGRQAIKLTVLITKGFVCIWKDRKCGVGAGCLLECLMLRVRFGRTDVGVVVLC